MMKDSMKNAILALSILALITACSQGYVCPDGSVVDSSADCDSEQGAQQEGREDAGSEDEPEKTAPKEDDEETAEPAKPAGTLAKVAKDLQVKAAKVQSYSFSYATLPENKAQRSYYVRGDKVKVLLIKPIVTEKKTMIDTVYIDRAAGKAVTYCTQSPSVCANSPGVITRPNPDDYEIILPTDIMADLTVAEDAGTRTLEGNVAQTLEFERDGEYWRIQVHKYQGVPMLVEIYPNADFTGEERGWSFREMAFNSVSESDVTPPDGY